MTVPGQRPVLPSNPQGSNPPGVAPARPGAPARPSAPSAPVVHDIDADGSSPSVPVRTPVRTPVASGPSVQVMENAGRPKFDLEKQLKYLYESGGSDLHLSVGAPPTIRMHGEMEAIPGEPKVEHDSLHEALMKILTPEQQAHFMEKHELDLAYMLPSVSRFRGNMFQQRHSTGAVFRVIPWDIKPLEALGLPPVVGNFASLHKGLVLVTGPTGSGKTTTLAALIDKANRTRSGHIMTVEDPIEFLHAHRGCIVNQREVGDDTETFATALRSVLRQDPDIILIGELRDYETVSIALTAAETGHLVFATLHTQSAQDSVNRIIDVFPSDAQGQIRSQLAATLKGVVSQTLVPSIDGKGRACAVEILVVNTAVATMIRQDAIHQIPQALQSGGNEGMQTLNQCLATMVANKTITREEGEIHASDVKDFNALLQGAEQRAGMSGSSSSQGGKPSSGGLSSMGSM